LNRSKQEQPPKALSHRFATRKIEGIKTGSLRATSHPRIPRITASVHFES
jgi:hypothetical protein